MAKTREQKTNALREIEAAGIPHRAIAYECDGALAGTEVAALLGEDPDRVFKTLVTQGKSGAHYVFMVPVACELDLKKAAVASGEKSIEMIKSKELLPLTGYVHGGCSPIGMKKYFTTYIDESATLCEKIFFSAGRIGCQIETTLDELQKVIPVICADIC